MAKLFDRYASRIDTGFIDFVVGYAGLNRPEAGRRDLKLAPGEQDKHSRRILKDVQETRYSKRARGRPRRERLFAAVLILKGYFEWKLGSPHWDLMAEIIEAHYKDRAVSLRSVKSSTDSYSPLQNWWQHMKSAFLDKHQITVNEIEYAMHVHELYLSGMAPFRIDESIIDELFLRSLADEDS